jgi:hypothetical protein
MGCQGWDTPRIKPNDYAEQLCVQLPAKSERYQVHIHPEISSVFAVQSNHRKRFGHSANAFHVQLEQGTGKKERLSHLPQATEVLF